ncbi:MAG: helix-turn-helix domain-containing protein [Pirellulaceae bacterium]|nr:helix-turn-helix domain-containing protein [Pirellulaceae bacterium]
MSEGSVTVWLDSLKRGDDEAARQLWNRYFARLVGLARSRLAAAPTRLADEEDAALSAFDSFCRGAEQGRFRQLEDRDDLWQLLVVLTVRKILDQRNYERRQKRAARHADGELAAAELTLEQWDQVLGGEPTPEMAAIVAEEFSRLMGRLEDAELRSIALLKMEGYTNQEVAEQLGCARRTVQRRLQLIKTLWEQELA